MSHLSDHLFSTHTSDLIWNENALIDIEYAYHILYYNILTKYYTCIYLNRDSPSINTTGFTLYSFQ